MEVRRKKRTRRYRECRSYYRVSNRRSDRRSQDVHRIAPVNGPFKEMPVFQDYEKLSNVKVEFIEAPTDGFQEKKTCCSPPMSA